MRLLMGVLFAAAVAASACRNQVEPQGQARVSVSALSAVDVAKVIVTVSGPALAQPKTFDLFKEGNTNKWGGLIGGIPAGDDAIFSVRATDGLGTLIFSGQTSNVKIVAGQVVTVVITAQQATPPAPFGNATPVIDSLVVSSTDVAPGDVVQLHAAAHDPDRADTITFAWSATGGTLSTVSGDATSWTAPVDEGSYQLSIKVTDNHGAYAGTSVTVHVAGANGRGQASVSVQINTWPTVSQVTATPGWVTLSQPIALAVVAADPDNDPLTYVWTSSCAGVFSSPGAANTTFAPAGVAGVQSCTFSVVVNDGRGGSASGTLTVPVGQPPVYEAPEIVTTVQSSGTVGLGGTVVFDITAADPQGSALAFRWTADAGSFSGQVDSLTTSHVTWTTPGEGTGGWHVSVIVSDAQAATTTQVFSIGLAGPVDGSSTGPDGSIGGTADAPTADAPVVDRQPPDTTITSGPADKAVISPTDGTVAFAFSGTDDITAPVNLLFQWRLDGGTWQGPAAATSANLTGLADGRHKFEVAAVDEQGNIDPTPDAREFAIASYTATLSTLVTTAPAGTQIPLTGQATLIASGAPAANVPVAIVIALRGTARTFSATTNTDGTFQLTFTPLPAEAGEYTAGARHPADYANPAQAQFTLVGMSASPNAATFQLATNGQATGQLTLTNLGDTLLTGLEAIVSGAPAGVQVTTDCPATLAASGSTTFNYALVASGADAVSGSIELAVSSAEGANAKLLLAITVVPATPRILVTPDHIDTGMLVGTQSSFELQVQNTGGATSAALEVQLPGVAWMSLASAATIDPLEPGQSTTVIVTLNPPAGLTLGNHKGSLVVGGVSVPFSLLATSDAKGGVTVLVQDELSYYDKTNNYPNLAGAKVTLQDAATQATAASGITATDGSLAFSSIPVGTYYIAVDADRHTSYRATVQVQAGTVTKVSAFLPLQLVTYDWSVVATTVPDVYNFQVDARFETNVPLPVIAIEPAYVDLRNLGCGEQLEVDFKISNHGLIAASNLQFDPQSGSDILVTPLVSALGDLAANSSITVPVVFEGSGSLCNTQAAHRLHAAPVVCLPPELYLLWDLICGDLKRQLKGVFFSGPHNPQCDPSPTPWTSPPTPSTSPAPSGAGGSGGGIGGGSPGLSNSSGTGTGTVTPNYVAPPLPDFHLDIPCDPCKASIYKAALWDCWLSHTPLGCVVPVFDFPKSESDSLRYLLGIARGCIKKEAMPVPDCEEGWLDAASTCSEELSGQQEPNTHSPIQDVGGGQLVVFSNLQRDADRYQTYSALWTTIFGDSTWMATNPADASLLSAWFDTFVATVDSGSDGAESVTEAERAKLLALPIARPLSATQVAAFIDRWNLTARNWAAGTFNSNNNVDFIDLNQFTQASAALRDVNQAAMNEGFSNLFEELSTDFDGVKSYADTASSGGVCGAVKVELDQQAVLSRAVFRATLGISNASTYAMDGLSVNLKVLDASGTDASALFAVAEPTLSGLSDIKGTGSITAGGNASAVWTIVPSDAAAPSGPVTYTVTGTISYQLNGTSLGIPLLPAAIQVLPLAKLTARYFWPKDVYSDDPFTTEIEPAEPFSVGLMISNAGAGAAENVRISSAQPQIVDNSKGLSVSFSLIGSQVNGQAITPSFAVNLGDIGPGTTGVAEWLMTSSLQGTFNVFDASIQHIDSLGTTQTSLFDKVETHQLVHPVRVTVPSDDGSPDFLVNDSAAPETMPGQVFSSDGSSASVAQIFAGAQADGVASGATHTIGLTVPSVPSGYVYIRTDDPGQGKFALQQVIRSDGVSLRIYDNAWTTHRTIHPAGQSAQVQNRLHIFDRDSTGTYTLVYGDATESPWFCAPPVLDGQTCDDGNLCTTRSHCAGGRCVGGLSVECPLTNQCPAANTCDPTTGFCSCGACPSGYTGTAATGCADINECATNNGGCDPLTTCTNTAGGFRCSGCPDGYTGTGSTGCTVIDGTCNAGVCGPPRCVGLAKTCGPSGNGDCCESLQVPGGTFYRSDDPTTPATVADFYLDKYEITVGRFRQFVNAGMGTQLSPPADGAGAHPLIPGSGWNSTWKTNLQTNTAALTTALKCNSTYQTWTDAAGANESKPQNCMSWYEAFAFCAWDGGRLATEAEWNYAAAGGSEQRVYPWSIPPTSTTIDDSYAVYCGGSCTPQNVGSKSPKGDGKWGHADLAGNQWEWTLDWYASYQTSCNNCADLTAASYRVIRGGSFGNLAADLRSAVRGYDDPWYLNNGIYFGARCARASDCPSGYTGTTATGCTDINECATNNGGCDPLTTCNNTAGGFRCSGCPDGYTGTGSTGCTVIDRCTTNSCLNGGTCTAGVNSFACHCGPGYSGTTCETKAATPGGTGTDGATSVASGTINLSTTNIAAGRSCADGGDAVSYSVIALSATTATLAVSPSAGCLSTNDEVVLINLQGTASANANVGNYETLRVASASGATVTFASSKFGYYGTGVSDDNGLGTTSADQRVAMIRVPNLGSLTVGSGATLTVNGWDGTKGGVLFLRSKGGVNIDGSISLDGLGYRGGERPTNANQDGFEGESYSGYGANAQAALLGAGGGGRGDPCASNGVGGGGAGYGISGTSAQGTPTICMGIGGGTYGNARLTKLFLGSGAGSGGNDNVLSDNPLGGLGGSGGGILVIMAGGNITVTGSISSRGTTGQGDAMSGCFGDPTSSCWDYSGPGGGGSGGSIYLSGDQVAIGASLVTAAAGAGGLGGESNGGDGGAGRIAVRYITSVSGNSTPAADAGMDP
jgi:formylglycine-generating enzyme required for sulfatase activity